MNPTPRIRSLDLLRGLIMVLMAIDHVRVYSGIPAGGPDPAIFFTRWITHFCVSGFVFFAGASAYLYGQRLRGSYRGVNDRQGSEPGMSGGAEVSGRRSGEPGMSRGQRSWRGVLARFLLTRGIWLILLELTVLRVCWSFNLRLTDFVLAGVIWMLGWCMLLMAAVVWMPSRVIWISGLVMIGAQQVFGLVPHSWTWWNFIYTISEDSPAGINILYVLVPWIGVMMAGYGFGALLSFDAARRDRLCRCIGLSLVGVFVVIGSILALRRGGEQPFLFRLLGQQKYPPSQLFLLMTLGPLIALMPLAEKAKGRLAGVLMTFGRVPLFYYILHILVIHSVALLVNWIRVGNSLQGHYLTAPYCWLPEGLRWHLPLLYLVFILVEIVLYRACRWYERYKMAHPEKGWLRYL